MTKPELATKLRDRQRKTGLVPEHIIAALPEDNLINSYITCSDCGAVWIGKQELVRIISESTTVEEFLSLTQRQACCDR
jgi:hypothetical protein